MPCKLRADESCLIRCHDLDDGDLAVIETGDYAGIVVQCMQGFGVSRRLQAVGQTSGKSWDNPKFLMRKLMPGELIEVTE